MHFLLALMTAILVALWQPTPLNAACLHDHDPNHFRLDATINFQVLPNGLLMVFYGDAATSLPSHVTLHRILATQWHMSETYTGGAAPVTLYQSERTSGGLVYVAKAHPLFFGTNLADDGFPMCLWADPQEDGLNGNEVLLSHVGRSSE